MSTPSFPESVKDGTIRFLKKVGDQVAADETIAEIETDKTNLSVNSTHAGTIEALLVADGDNVTSGAPIAKLNTSGGGGAKAAPPAEEAKSKGEPEQKHGEPAKKSEESSGSAPSKAPSVPATPKGPQRETATSQISVTPAKPQKQPPQGALNVSGTDPNKITGTRSETRVRMSRMRLKIAERLKEAQNTCAMLTTFNEIDMRYWIPQSFAHNRGRRIVLVTWWSFARNMPNYFSSVTI